MRTLFAAALAVIASAPASANAQEYGKADAGEPGDAVIQRYLRRTADDLDSKFLEGIKTLEDWEKARARLKEEYFYSLGLSPLPPKTPLYATVTGRREGDGYIIEMLHYQSRPGLYVTGNLYRPKNAKADEKLPAVFYVCGHSMRGRDGNKTAYQSHGIWFARHGYVCLVVDSLQLGEIAAIHHGTYRENRWWWHARGYTPAGVECWNGVRGIDYLISRPDVDPDRIAVTGISGGGAATFWIAAADERVNVAVPVSGMADLSSYVSNRVINGHCDCMFLYNTFRWPWTNIAALIAPRAQFYVNSDSDVIFPMDANDRIINRLERIYSLYGAGDQVDALVSIGGHAYREDIRKGAYRFINTHLKGDPRAVADSEVDLVVKDNADSHHPIRPQELRVFPSDGDIPKDQINTTVDRVFVPLAQAESPTTENFEEWRGRLVAELRRVSFGALPERVPPAARIGSQSPLTLRTDDGFDFELTELRAMESPGRIVLVVGPEGDGKSVPDWLDGALKSSDAVWSLDPRGVGKTKWTIKNPPNYVARSHALLGQTVDTGRVRDVIATARWFGANHQIPIALAGQKGNGVLAAYAALLEPDVTSVIASEPPASHMDDAAPQLLNVLRVCDIPQTLGLLAPRELTVIGGPKEAIDKVQEVYAAGGAKDKLRRTAAK